VTGRRSDAGARRRVLLALGAAATARLGLAGAAALDARPAGAPWRRPNHAGREVTLLGGPALALAATAGAVAGAPAGTRAAAALVGAVSGLVGGYDDLAGARPEQARDKGLAGHLRALRAGRVSAGAVKVAGIGAAAAAAALLVKDPAAPRASLRSARDPAAGPFHRLTTVADAVVTTGLVAGTANLVNLLDLRPGRAAKAAALAAAAGLGGPSGALVAGPLGASLAVLPADLRERVMLGDCGANAVGALLGLRLAAVPGRPARAGVLAAVVGLTLASERVSFTRVIEATPGLRELDRLGRRTA
jgi:UDP-N-acetylmuramyl pentapeptide phosphotransferase/UDP-N-acetylglucosamine-1-phosphate transferase